MRQTCRLILKEQFHLELLKTRRAYGLTQMEMAALLLMDPRSYLELDHGSSLAGTLTFVLYLLSLCPDPAAFLEAVRASLPEDLPRLPAGSVPCRPPAGLPVSEILVRPDGCAFPICPRCETPLEREYQAFCDRCGQALLWRDYPHGAAVRRVR